MELNTAYVKQFYKLQLTINRLSERDRMLLLFISIMVLLSVWYFAVFYFQIRTLEQAKQSIQEIQTKSANLKQKTRSIETLVKNPNIAILLAHHDDLIKEIAQLDEAVLNYNKRYINSSNLAKLMHDLLKTTDGVVIDSFSTLVIPPVTATEPNNESLQQSTPQSIPKKNLSLEPIHYQLIMKGGYFSIINYLKRLEELPWYLYWDKLDYTVTNYPEGKAVLDFYTLRPTDNQATDATMEGKS